MDGPLGVSTLQKEQMLQQHQDRSQGYQKQRDAQEEQARYFLRQNLQQLSSEPASLEPPQQPGFVAPSALSSAPAAPSFATTTSDSPSSASAWQDSPTSNPLSPPTSNSSVSPPVDPAILNSPVQDAKVLAVGTKPAGNAEAPSRRRGRPRLSETGPALQAKTKTQNKKKATTTAAAARRASDASSADDHQQPRAAGGGPNDKRDRVRARNREAAYKCRKKKQRGIAELQSQEAVVEGIHRNLTAEATALRGEILMLKNMVLQHGGCGCSYIEEYVSGAAQNLVQSSMAAAAAASSAPAQGETGFDSSSNQPPRAGSEGFVDWKMLDVESRNGMSAFGSESGFSGVDDASVTHSSRAQSRGPTAV